MSERMSADQARDALATVEQSRRRVIDEIDMPRWYWGGLAVAWLALGVIADLGRSWFTTAAILVFGAGHAVVSSRVAGGRRRSNRLQVHAAVVSGRAQLLVVAGLVGLVGLTVAGALLADADHAGHPVTVASIVVTVAVVFGGPTLMGAIRKRAARGGLPG